VATKGQTWTPAGYDRNARFVTDLGAPVIELLAPRPRERILDLGCGDGVLTEKLVAAGCDVVGVDSSPEMIAAARARGLDARVINAHDLPFRREFDAVFSNAALHWMPDADAVIAGVARALRPGGRFVAEMGGHGCVAAVLTALIAVLARCGIDGRSRIPWYFPTVDDYRARLVRAGFNVDYIELIPRPTPLPTGMAGWLETFANPFLSGMSAEERADVVNETVELLRPALCDEQGCWTADYTRLRFKATLARVD
jgi:trans-aconitate methyltransferase